MCGGLHRELLLHDDIAVDAERLQRLFEHGAKQLALARVRANVRVADLLRIDHAADDERGPNTAHVAGLAIYHATDVFDEQGDRSLRAARDDLHPARDFARVLLLRGEAVMIRLPGLLIVGIAQLDPSPEHGVRGGGGAAERHSDRKTGFHAKAERETRRARARRHARHFISSLTSSKASARLVYAE